MGKHILAVTASPIANDNRVINYTNALANHGHNVHLICPEKGEVSSEYQFTTVYISILTRRLPSLFAFAKALEFYWRSVRISKKIPCDVLHANDLYGLVLANLIKRYIHRKAAIVYDAHEYETEMNGLSGFKKVLFKYFERKLIKHISSFITVSDSIAAEYQRLYGIDKSTVLLNVPKIKRQADEVYDLFRDKFEIRTDQRIFLYQGNLMAGRGIEILLKTFSNFDSDRNVIVFMGKGSLEGMIRDHTKSGNVYFQEFMGPKEYLKYTSSADVGISFIEDISLSDRYCLPNKLFEYIFCGLPVICSNLPEMKKLVESHEIGIVADENTEEGFKHAVDKMNKVDLKVFKANIPKASNQYSWENQEAKLIKLYNEF